MKESVNHILYRINEEAVKYFCSVLLSNQGKEGVFWLNDVGLSVDTINRFSIGYAGEDKKGLVSHLNDLGYTNEQIIEAGLAECADGDIKDKYRNRIMIPIIDEHNRVIGFSGRVVGKSVPKYLVSYGTPIFDKSSSLFGMNYVKDSSSQYIILCEGLLDVIVMNQAGFDMAVSLIGTRFTLGHAKQIKKYTQNVILCFDTDEYGRKETNRAITILNQTGIKARNMDLSPYRDPLEFISMKGGAVFGSQLNMCWNNQRI